MHAAPDRVHLSPSDLVNFLGCPHCTVLDVSQLNAPGEPRTFSATDQLLAQKGREHERGCLNRLRAEGKSIADLATSDEVDRAVRTIEAMRAGADVVYQATLAFDRWNGVADFLLKTDRPSALGAFSYEPLDTKLARHSDPNHIIQLGVYSDLVGKAQGVDPDKFRVVLGTGKEEVLRARDFAAYVAHARRRIELFVDEPPTDSYPRPCGHCGRCHWRERCEEQWEQDDRLNLVANATRSQVDKLERAGIKTLAKLAATSDTTRVPDLNPAVFQRLRAQAVLQQHKRTTGENKYELIAAEADRGFARLPKPDASDIFFDMEGDPLYPDGLEYLFGICYQTDGRLSFRPFWAHDHDEEQKSFRAFMRFLADHLAAHPNAFVYHYNHYEPTALKRLAARYAVAEHQLDELLRGHKFVDLYKVVRESIRISEPSYSLKNLETFYMPKRDGEVANAGDSIVVYNRWRVLKESKLLDDIERYNEIDCRSTAGLRDWLLKLRPADGPWFDPKADVTDEDEAEERQRERSEQEAQFADHQNRLRQLGAARKDAWPCRLADLLGFHAREAKPEWWAFFDRMDKFPDELLDDAECLAGLERVGNRVPEKRSFLYTFKFPPQETKRQAGDGVINVATGTRAGDIVELDEQNCLVKLKLGQKNEPLPPTLSVGPTGPISTDVLREALYRIARTVIDGADTYLVVQRLLAKDLPRIVGREPGRPIVAAGELLSTTTEAIAGLNRSYLFIQGPPGAGKTYTSAHVIVQLLRRGKKVGVAANSHKAIHNLLAEVERLAVEAGVAFQGVKKSSTGADTEFNGQFIRSESDKKKIDPAAVDLLAGTAWLFADERFDRALDYLFIDEAGQVALANVVAMGTSAANIVLVGDQMQLGQPTQGVHPGESGLSVLDFLLGGQATVSPDRGVFLAQTRRLRPELCRFVSDAFYDGRLEPHPITAKRKLIFSPDLSTLPAAGVHFLKIEHSGCSQRCDAEGRAIATYFRKMLDQQFEDSDGNRRQLTIDDVLVVSPYNVQVNYLRSVLPDGARVGTVDKFQGQEAPVVFVSMATSSAADMPRDIGFLFSANRLNVAVSRAQCLAVVFASPELLATPCNTVDDLRLVNKFCQLAAYGCPGIGSFRVGNATDISPRRTAFGDRSAQQ